MYSAKSGHHPSTWRTVDAKLDGAEVLVNAHSDGLYLSWSLEEARAFVGQLQAAIAEGDRLRRENPTPDDGSAAEHAAYLGSDR